MIKCQLLWSKGRRLPDQEESLKPLTGGENFFPRGTEGDLLGSADVDGAKCSKALEFPGSVLGPVHRLLWGIS